ncbi:hypothetical protein Celaphus_00004505 [Cervus elaphus hippelaphus]|uniref:Uncharacterized protein n=1 Tax=Cervus elaphus hippelaphus TaxID=46360 RepID=A0A212DCR6_CEREH|nr:hypothetical protein Celaphus_00004505 [Cervus elaphus hippelaphus]
MCLSILALFLCFPIGIVAVIFSIQSHDSPLSHTRTFLCPSIPVLLITSNQTRHCNRWNNRAMAAETSHQTFYIAVLGIVMGSVIILIILIFSMTDLFSR